MKDIYNRPLSKDLEVILLLEDITPAWENDNHLDELVKLEAQIIEAGGELVLIHPHGVWYRHTLG